MSDRSLVHYNLLNSVWYECAWSSEPHMSAGNLGIHITPAMVTDRFPITPSAVRTNLYSTLVGVTWVELRNAH